MDATKFFITAFLLLYKKMLTPSELEIFVTNFKKAISSPNAHESLKFLMVFSVIRSFVMYYNRLMLSGVYSREHALAKSLATANDCSDHQEVLKVYESEQKELNEILSTLL